MSSPPSTVYLITGSNRGLGLGLVSTIVVSHPDAFVYAGSRDPSKATELEELSQKDPRRIAVVKCVSADAAGNAELAKLIKEKHGRVDTVIANAAAVGVSDTVLKTDVSEFQAHFTVNVLGIVVLFQELHDLLKASPSPRFVPISTGGASLGRITNELPLNIAPYGSSKAAMNYITRKIHFESEWLIAFPLAPGVVLTDALKETLVKDESGLFKRMLERSPGNSIEVAAKLLVDIIDKATRETNGGEFFNVDGTKLGW